MFDLPSGQCAVRATGNGRYVYNESTVFSTFSSRVMEAIPRGSCRELTLFQKLCTAINSVVGRVSFFQTALGPLKLDMRLEQAITVITRVTD